MIAPTAIIGGLGMSIGMERIKVDGATGDYHTNLSAKGRAVVRELAPGTGASLPSHIVTPFV